jgi:hypothetical protein
MRLAATFLNYVHAIEIAQLFRRLRIPPIVIFLRVAGKQAYKNGSGPSLLKGWRSVV